VTSSKPLIDFHQVDDLIKRVKKNLYSCGSIAVVYNDQKELKVIRDQSSRFSNIHFSELVGVYTSESSHNDIRNDIIETVQWSNEKRNSQIRAFNKAVGVDL
tara:strand:+ start:255 stop:560 length:306 start_codon:yes stop_codon:yes gene_type:complete